jgi:dTDP-3-amino-2,3,6-trideoxy-4-keto-D-glucose/dTDP-3-amino-3,4,6-trideoxy-alpha-D-glucose/dTDP-2,6-dideoxy-D-kanosamine transaminase
VIPSANPSRAIPNELHEQIEQALLSACADGCFILGPEVDAFERSWAKYCGAEYCVGVGNGTDALYLALIALGIGAGHMVGTVANAGGFATNAILRAQATPSYIEIDPGALLVDIKQIDAKPRALIVTHLYGSMVDVDAIKQRFSGPIIEDCSHAHGIKLRGEVACFSFYPTKNLGAIGDAGAVVTNSPDIAQRIHSLRQYGWGEKYDVQRSGGINSRMDEIQAALLNVKLPHLHRWNYERQVIARRLRAGISHRHIRAIASGRSFNHQFVVVTPYRANLRNHLRNLGIETAIHYPIPDDVVSLPHTEKACNEVLSLPCYPGLRSDEIDQIVEGCNSWKP